MKLDILTRQLAERWIGKFKSLSLTRLYLLTISISVLCALTYFFATYFPTLYLFAIAFLLLKLIFTEITRLTSQRHHQKNNRHEIFCFLMTEFTDILLMVTIILANTSYYAIGIFALAVYWAITTFIYIEQKTKSHVEISHLLDHTHRITALLIFTVPQLILQEFSARLDVLFLYFVWIILAGIGTLIFYCRRERG
ncbi:MAG TPA: hypothetical protein DIC51_06560 [Coxiellaceae bacterium]|nr:hypothetical protein [Coxiellaceae bacterium]